jgi:ATP-binding cassette, subfamily B, bacterial MsbA
MSCFVSKAARSKRRVFSNGTVPTFGALVSKARRANKALLLQQWSAPDRQMSDINHLTQTNSNRRSAGLGPIVSMCYKLAPQLDFARRPNLRKRAAVNVQPRSVGFNRSICGGARWRELCCWDRAGSSKIKSFAPWTASGMHNFLRTLRLVLRYKTTLALSTFTAIMVAVLWGFNIGGAYPIIAIITENKSVQQWLADDIKNSDVKIADFETQIDALKAKAAAANPQEKPAIESELQAKRNMLQVEQDHKARIERYQPYAEKYLPHDPYQTVFVIMMVISLGYILKNIFLVMDCILVDRLANLATLDLRKKFYRRTLRMDLSSFGEARVSELMSRFTYDVDSIGQGVQTVIGRAIREPLKMAACLGMAAWLNWRLLLVSLLIAPVAGYLISRLAKTLKRANRKALEEMSGLYNILSETLGGIKVVKAFTMERHERLRFHRNSKEFYRKAKKISRFDALIHPVTELAGITMICLTILAGTYLILHPNQTHLFGIRLTDRPMQFADLTVFYAMLAGSIDPARKLTEVFNRVQRASAAADRVYQMFDREATVRDPIKPRPIKRHHRDITIENVSFNYNPEQPVLIDVSLRIPYGETLAIVGPNGSGKTTLANLIPRFYDPQTGSIKIDSVDLRDMRMRELRGQIGLVTQDPLLFDDTVFNNIKYGTPGATKQQVIDAARKAHAHRFIEENLEQGYETNVGQLGGRLSGGQRQRISLARAILRDPPILILDEATSQIDIESEHVIHKVLEQFSRDRTAIIITHRLATLDLADRILVMDAGRVLDLGAHEELIGRCELYRRLYQIHLKETA